MAAPASPKLLIPGERNILLPYANNAPHLGSIIGKGCLPMDHVVAQLVEMGFHLSKAVEAVEIVGPRLEVAVEFLLNGSSLDVASEQEVQNHASSGHECSTARPSCSSSSSVNRTRQTSITEHLIIPAGQASKLIKSEKLMLNVSSRQKMHYETCSFQHPILERVQVKDFGNGSQETVFDWEEKVNNILPKYFGFSSLKSFQREAIEAWLRNQDCLILAATGSGKSLCFQLPALLTRKVVVVISPLISLMRDQCLKLAVHGVSACFLGSGQSDPEIEQKALSGMYNLVYVCPETILRLIVPLQSLAEKRGIALFAIDEVHCVSKWGHDFRPSYRSLCVLRESFSASQLSFLKSDVPLMALTATATTSVREDIIKSLKMSKETKIVLTSFFRPNLRFSVKHSKTTSMSSFSKDFREILDAYGSKTPKSGKKVVLDDWEEELDGFCSSIDAGDPDLSIIANYKSDEADEDIGDGKSRNFEDFTQKSQLSIQFLDDEHDACQDGHDLDVSCGEFTSLSHQNWSTSGRSYNTEQKIQPQISLKPSKAGYGPTIIYVPTRKETVVIAKYLCDLGVKAAPYHAKLPKIHLRRVHEEFHQNIVKVVVATVAFGMGIDKSNVRRIIHYGWPQCLEAYYQEAGRAGRDGSFADCTLYADLSRIPTLLPSQRSEEQTKHAYKLLSDCYRYGMSTSSCRAKALVEYFGESFSNEKCLVCDTCVGGLPKLQNLKVDADVFMHALSSHHMSEGADFGCIILRKPNMKMVVSTIRAKFPEYAATDQLWWRGLSRILEEKGFIREGNDTINVSIKYPELTGVGLSFLSNSDESLYAYPEADMLLAMQMRKEYSTFSDWGRGWADPVIREQRLRAIRSSGKRVKKRKHRKHRLGSNASNSGGVRQRIMTKLSNPKR